MNECSEKQCLNSCTRILAVFSVDETQNENKISREYEKKKKGHEVNCLICGNYINFTFFATQVQLWSISSSSSTSVAPFHHTTGPSPCSAIEHCIDKIIVSSRNYTNKWLHSRKRYMAVSWILSLLVRLRSVSVDQVRRHKTHQTRLVHE